MTMQRTFSIIKPDATRRNLTGKINATIEAAGLRIIAQKRVQLTQAQAEGFYAVHKERAFFNDLVSFMISGPVVVQVLEGDDAVDVRHGGLAHEGVTVPCSAVLPRQVVGGLAVLHDGRDAVVVVRRHGIVAGSLRFCVFVVCQFLLPLSQFALQFL